jgi:hypothetical protein
MPANISDYRRCDDCHRITTKIEAEERRFNTGRCADCGGDLTCPYPDGTTPAQMGQFTMDRPEVRRLG